MLRHGGCATCVHGPDMFWLGYGSASLQNWAGHQLCVTRVFGLCLCLRVVSPPREQVWNEFGERMKIYAKQKRKWREESVRR